MGDRKKFDLSQTKLRSAVTNGRRVLADVDHRGAEMRRLRDLVHLHVSDLGGENSLSHAERVLVGRASMLTLQCELMEGRFAQKEGAEATPNELETYQRCANTLRRLLESLGLQRRSKNITPTLAQYRESQRQIGAEDAEGGD
jgi:hypothetical protein